MFAGPHATCGHVAAPNTKDVQLPVANSDKRRTCILVALATNSKSAVLITLLTSLVM